MERSVLPDWVFRTGWGMPLAREFLQLRMEAAQRHSSLWEARSARFRLNRSVAKKKHETNTLLHNWAIKTSVPAGAIGKAWGDLYFAEEIAASLVKSGIKARVDRRDQVINPQSKSDDVILVIRGVERIRPQKGAINILWIISHPSRISKHELRGFDLVFAASDSWATWASKKFGVPVWSLLQATNPEKFNPDVARPDTGENIIFIGNTRNEFRKIIKDCLSVGIEPSVYGKDWNRYIPSNLIKGDFVPNEEVAKKYRAAGVVLNDHWPDMARQGFISNRLFDAAASGARIISDDVSGIHETFRGAVQVYHDAKQLHELCDPHNRAGFGDETAIRERALKIGLENSFDDRTATLLRAVNGKYVG